MNIFVSEECNLNISKKKKPTEKNRTYNLNYTGKNKIYFSA